MSDTSPFRYAQLAEMAREMGLRLKHPFFGDGSIDAAKSGYQEIAHLLETADAFILDGFEVPQVGHLRSRFNERVDAGAHAVVIPYCPTSDDLEVNAKFLARYYIQPISTKIVGPTTCLAAAERALDGYRKLGDLHGIAQVQILLGQSLVIFERFAEAEPLLQEALKAARMLGHRRLTAEALKILAQARTLVGDFTGARTAYTEALTLAHAVGAEFLAASVAARSEFVNHHADRISGRGSARTCARSLTATKATLPSRRIQASSGGLVPSFAQGTRRVDRRLRDVIRHMRRLLRAVLPASLLECWRPAGTGRFLVRKPVAVRTTPPAPPAQPDRPGRLELDLFQPTTRQPRIAYRFRAIAK